ncbi:hypothetical protein CHS0354_035812 [Potamilus streckersoni]|uniref:Transporter n=1 Tax=Potamilus streckersoni TaxID=2493646 RepID=A0AAE0SXP8_9BIVA|nr:hypothetical protein CHS0354_035812 [Potamilus streckersoni]
MPRKYRFTQKKEEEFPNDSTYNTSNHAACDVRPSVNSEEVERGEWANKWEFILSCIGMSVGLGNVWRFPYLAYANGGAAFLIAYIILQFLVGKPMYLMELILAQYSGKGPTAVWAMNPSGKGIGIAQGLISLVATVYYNVIMTYTLYYLFASMQATLPWTVCKEEWKQYGCVEQTTKRLKYCDNPVVIANNFTDCRCTLNATFDNSLSFNCTNTSYIGEPTAVADLYFNKEVIHKAINMYPEDLGPPLWKLALCLLLSWIIVVICLIKGIKSSGKVVYFTATFPYVILLILLVRGATLDGAIDGVKYFVIPKWEKLLDLKVWVAAAGQMFFSLSVSFGGIIMFGSYNKFKNQVYGDSMLIAVMDLLTSIIASFVIFMTFGGMAKDLGVGVQDVAKAGYGLAFVAYPEALSTLPPPQLWSILFFFMLFTLGLDSEAGDYVVRLMDNYGTDFSVLFLAFCESVAVMWVYGIRRLIDDATYMLGRAPRPIYYWGFCWAFCCPVIIGLLFVYRMAQYNPPMINDNVPYPQFAQIIGWILATFVMCPVPLVFLYKMYQAKGSLWKRLRTITTPTSEWGPNDGSMKQEVEMDNVANDLKYGLDNPVLVVENENQTKL